MVLHLLLVNWGTPCLWRLGKRTWSSLETSRTDYRVCCHNGAQLWSLARTAVVCPNSQTPWSRRWVPVNKWKNLINELIFYCRPQKREATQFARVYFYGYWRVLTEYDLILLKGASFQSSLSLDLWLWRDIWQNNNQIGNLYVFYVMVKS